MKADAPTYEPFTGPITLDTLSDLFAHQSARFAGWQMVEEDDDDDDTIDTGDDDGGDDGDDEGDDEGDDYKPPTRKEWAATQAALKKANAEAKKRRLAAKKAAEEAADDDGEDKSEKARAETEAKWKPRVIKQGAKAALAAAGAMKAERLFGLLDLDALDVDDDGDIEGLEDEVDRLKEDFPELFRRPRTGKIETGDRSGGRTAGKARSATERQAAAILGKK